MSAATWLALVLPLGASPLTDALAKPVAPSVAPSATAPADATRSLDLDAALAQLMAQSPRLQAAQARAAGATASAHSGRSRLLPHVDLMDEQLRYRQPFTIALNPSGPPLVARGYDTNTFVAQASQPLLGLISRVQAFAAQRHGARAAQLDLATVTADLRLEMRATFLRLFEVEALAATAVLSERTLGQQLDEARARVKAGALTEADALRIEVAQAEARQQHLAADAQVRTLRAALLELLGLGPDDGSVSFLEPHDLKKLRDPPELLSARAMALEKRTELHSGAEQVAASSARARAKGWAMLPEVDLVGNYTHIQGQRLAPKNAAYIGLRANWRVWEWGAQYYDLTEAAAAAEAQAQLQEDARRRIGAEVAGRHAEVVAASSALDVANLAVTAAAEAFRVTTAQASAGVATTTDLLAAESALSRARANQVHARFEAAVAQVTLDRVMGREEP